MLYIIVTYNGEQYIQNCIESVQQHDTNAEIWVYDNGSKDSTLSILTHLGVKYQTGKENLGFGAANNIGLTHFLKSNHSYCFLLNQDAYITEHTIQAQHAALKHPHSIIAPIQLTGDGKDFDHNFKSKYLNPKFCPNFYSDLYFNRLQDTYAIDFAPAAAWIIPKFVVETVGGFNPSFFHYGEDVNYIHRCQYHGIMMRLVPNAAVLHDRQNRKPHFKHKSQKPTKKRQLTLDLSNPNNSGYGIHSRILSYLKPLSNYPLSPSEVRRAINNRETSRKPGPSFLSKSP